MDKVAGAIITFARPDYYRRALKSLEQCDNSDKIDWFVYQDGYENYPKDIYSYRDLHRNLLLSNIAITYGSKLNIIENYISRENNGVNYSINNIVKLFDEGYDTIFIFEDDLVVSPYYLNLLYNCSLEYPNMVASFHSLNRTKDSALKKLVRCHAPRLWGFYLTRVVWNKIRDDWNNFYGHTKDMKRRDIPFYDTVFTQAIRKRTMGKFEAVVPRAFNIGKIGHLSYTEEQWNRKGLNKQTEYIMYKRDKNLKGFILGQ